MHIQFVLFLVSWMTEVFRANESGSDQFPTRIEKVDLNVRRTFLRGAWEYAVPAVLR